MLQDRPHPIIHEGRQEGVMTIDIKAALTDEHRRESSALKNSTCSGTTKTKNN